MSVLIIGANGSMGKRYQVILKYLGKEIECADLDTKEDELTDMLKHADAVIVATPTGTHYEILKKIIPFRKPILCEKPVTKNLADLKEIGDDLRNHGTPFRMMLQYEMLTLPAHIGPTRFNYFRHGNDGLIWDCLQIIALARGDVILKEDSPVWGCKINGRALNISHMDAAYIAYVNKWLQFPRQNFEKITAIHEKVAAYERKVLPWQK